MLIAALLAVALAPTSSQGAAYFPLIPGTKWVYRETSEFSVETYEDEVLEPVDIEGSPAFPIQTKHNKKVIETVYYRESGHAIVIVAYDPEKPLDPPRPLLKAGDAKEKWTYNGFTPMMSEAIPIRLKGESTPKGSGKFKDIEGVLLEVVLEAELGTGKEKFLVSKQTSSYLKGVGLIEMHERSTSGGRTRESRLKLIEFTPGRP